MQDQFDETDHFFMSVANIVKKLPRYEQAKLIMQISTLITELQHVLNQNEYSDSMSGVTRGVTVMF